MLRKLKLRLRALFRRDDIGDELTLHLEQLTGELIAGGLSPREARLAASRQFGNLTRIHEQSRELFSFGLVEDLLRDLQYGWRSIRRNLPLPSRRFCRWDLPSASIAGARFSSGDAKPPAPPCITDHAPADSRD